MRGYGEAVFHTILCLRCRCTGDGYTHLGTAANGQEAHLFCRHTVPDLILMDIRMPVMDGVAATKHIKAEFPHIKIVLLTTFKEEAYIKEALENGAEGYILKILHQGAGIAAPCCYQISSLSPC